MDFEKAFGSQERHIIECYLALMEVKPYDRITVKELTEKSSIHRTTFYRFFKDTYDLLEKLEQYLLGEFVLYNALSDSDSRSISRTVSREKPYEDMRMWFETGLRLRPQLKPLLGRYGDLYFKERLRRRVKDELTEMMNDENAPFDIMRSYYVEAISMVCLGLLTQVVLAEDENVLSPDELTTIANSMRGAYFYSREEGKRVMQ